MNCSESQDLLQRRLDGEPIENRAALDRHLATCADCRTLHAAAGRLEDGLRVLPMPRPPFNLSARIVAGVVADRRTRVRAPRRVLATMALAASLLIAVTIAWVNKPSHSDSKNPVAIRDTHNLPRPEAVPLGPSLRDSVAEAGSAVVSITRKTAGETISQTRLLTDALPITSPLPGFDPMPPTLEPPVQTALQSAGQGLSSGLEPMTNSARRMFSMMIRDTMPARDN